MTTTSKDCRAGCSALADCCPGEGGADHGARGPGRTPPRAAHLLRRPLSALRGREGIARPPAQQGRQAPPTARIHAGIIASSGGREGERASLGDSSSFSARYKSSGPARVGGGWGEAGSEDRAGRARYDRRNPAEADTTGTAPFRPGSDTMLTEVLSRQTKWLKRQPPAGLRRHFWGWLNAVFNQVDHERIQAVGPDRAASEWLLRCGASVRYHGYDKWQQDYNALPMGPLEKYKIQAINATESCIMNKGFDYFDGLKHLEEIKFCKCIYIEDACLQRISETPSLQKSLLRLFLISCGNVTDQGIIALHKLSNLEYLFLCDLPGIRDKEITVQSLKKSMPALELELDLE